MKTDEAKSIEVLGFNRFEKKEITIQVDYSPEMARYILKDCNNDNRDFIDSQRKKLDKSIRKNGFVRDGGAVVFNTEGNLHEWQHRMEKIALGTKTIKNIPTVLGVKPDTWTQTTEAAKRTSLHEVQRYLKKHGNPKGLKGEELKNIVSTITQVMSRRKGPTNTLDTAGVNFVEWNETVIEGETIVKDFFRHGSKWDGWRVKFSAWASLMVFINEKETAINFLKLLKEETLKNSSTALTTEFIEFWEKENSYMKSAEQSTFLWHLLCVASDRMIENPAGNISLNLSIAKCNHDSLKLPTLGSVYRKFLYDADGNMKKKTYVIGN
jgi:hypothetical protein